MKDAKSCETTKLKSKGDQSNMLTTMERQAEIPKWEAVMEESVEQHCYAANFDQAQRAKEENQK